MAFEHPHTAIGEWGRSEEIGRQTQHSTYGGKMSKDETQEGERVPRNRKYEVRNWWREREIVEYHVSTTAAT